MAVKYFEDWFYRGDFLKEFETEEEGEIYYVGSAFIVNQLAKIKEVQENSKSVSGFEGQKLEQLIEEVKAFAEDYLTEENLSKRIEKIKVVLEKKESELQPLLEKREEEIQPIDQEIQKNITELKVKYERIYGLLRNSDLDSIFDCESYGCEVQSFFEILEKYNAFSDFSKQGGCLHELVNKGGSLLEALAEVMLKRYNSISRDDPKGQEIKQERISLMFTKNTNFQNWLQRNKNDSKEGGKKQQKMSGFEALAKLKEDTMKAEAIELIEGIVSKSYYAKEALEIAKQRKLKGEVVDRYAEIGVSSKNLEIEKIKQELEAAKALFLDRKKIERTLESSIISIKESLRRPAGDLYLLKTIIIAAAEQIKANKDTIFPVLSPDKFVTNRLEVFDFSDFSRDYGEGQRNSNGESSYKKIHFIQAHLPFAQFVVEYMKNKKQNNFEKK